MRIILTGFADMEAIVESINDGHVYAYISKPWEPDHLKQVMKQAVDHYALAVENERLLIDLKHANVFLEAVMDQLDTGALAVDDAEGVVQAVPTGQCAITWRWRGMFAGGRSTQVLCSRITGCDDLAAASVYSNCRRRTRLAPTTNGGARQRWPIAPTGCGSRCDSLSGPVG